MKTIKEIRDYGMTAANGKAIRMATMVVMDDGTEIRFTERMSKKAARENVAYQMRRSA